MKRLVQSTDFNVAIPISSTKHAINDDYYMFQKYKCSSPAILGDVFRCNTPVQSQLSPIENQQKSCFSLLSDNFDISVKDVSRKYNNVSRQLSIQKENEDEINKIQRIIKQEQIILEEQEILNKKLKNIRFDTNKKLEELDQCKSYQNIQEYLKRRLEIIKQLQQSIGQYISNSKDIQFKEPPLKSALKKKENKRQHTQDKYEDGFNDEDSQDDWNFIHQAKINLEKQRTHQNTDDERTPSKVRFVSTRDANQKKKMRKSINLSDLNALTQLKNLSIMQIQQYGLCQ
ncbi:unnamed protein product (macronuclear) [Paramecium tetraurelia]|uniref:Uncharacterized protein n=1 Tax=Paramecium tetraurelia TaxID=5888 RepID=A0CN85_PARTE|nr:uncharacterized protein GSPATT00008693001 [Paramecium tetraurelia]CAK72252.1 unnamed protein product [Paramecium tetraurelia]|eukprot:XP_001439649.1 hypothetical protein (macronuclear) [Paramecium tetraurelia strain d4-2]